MSRNQTSRVNSTLFELLVITGLSAISMGLLLPVIQSGEHSAKRPVQKVRNQSLAAHHRGATPLRTANM